jgi:hypothetical protein
MVDLLDNELDQFCLFRCENTLQMLSLIRSIANAQPSSDSRSASTRKSNQASVAHAAATGDEYILRYFGGHQGVTSTRKALLPLAGRCLKLLDQYGRQATQVRASVSETCDESTTVSRLRERLADFLRPLYWPAEKWLGVADGQMVLLSMTQQLLLLDDILAWLETKLTKKEPDRILEFAPYLNVVFELGVSLGSTLTLMRHFEELRKVLLRSVLAATKGGMRAPTGKYAEEQRTAAIRHVFEKLREGKSMRAACDGAVKTLTKAAEKKQAVPHQDTIRRWVSDEKEALVNRVLDRMGRKGMTRQAACEEVADECKRSGISLKPDQLADFVGKEPYQKSPYQVEPDVARDKYSERYSRSWDPLIESALDSIQHTIEAGRKATK